MDYRNELRLLKRFRKESKYVETIKYIDRQIEILKENYKNENKQ